MELTIGNTFNTSFSARNFLLVISIVVMITAGNLMLSRDSPAVGYNRYTGYGFSIDYSQRMTLREVDLEGSGPPTDESGIVQWTRQEMELEQFSVIWISPEIFSLETDINPETVLDEFFFLIETSGTVIGDRGEFRTTTHDGHDVVYQKFTLVDSGIGISSLIGSWYCENNEKFFILNAIHVPDIENPEVMSQRVESNWLEYLDTLSCN